MLKAIQALKLKNVLIDGAVLTIKHVRPTKYFVELYFSSEYSIRCILSFHIKVSFSHFSRDKRRIHSQTSYPIFADFTFAIAFMKCAFITFFKLLWWVDLLGWQSNCTSMMWISFIQRAITGKRLMDRKEIDGDMSRPVDYSRSSDSSLSRSLLLSSISSFRSAVKLGTHHPPLWRQFWLVTQRQSSLEWICQRSIATKDKYCPFGMIDGVPLSWLQFRNLKEIDTWGRRDRERRWGAPCRASCISRCRLQFIDYFHW